MIAPRRGVVPVTLVLTVHNSMAELPDLLTSIEGQRLLPAELSITDLGSTDGTLRLLRSWQPPCGMTVKVFTSVGASTSRGRNLAIESASHDRIAVTHGATRLHPEWMASMWAALAEGDDVVAGQIQPVGSSLMERTIGRVETPEPGEIDPITALPSSRSLAFSKSRWNAVGGYPERLRHGQDKAFDQALRDAGAVFRFVPAAGSSWNPRRSLIGQVTQCFQVAGAEGGAGIVSGPRSIQLAAGLGGLAGLLLFRRSRLLSLLGAGSVAAHVGPHLRRVWRTRDGSPDGLPVRLLATLAVVVGGDLGRVAGYPAGVLAACWKNQVLRRVQLRGGGPGGSISARPASGRPAPGRHRLRKT